ncbi:hypothetical protein HZC00_04730 [Candidatus Kaiserbacteria bacterium]|nr:hypothetical protein [Candidatus Kaiserbacteria bacterium]
MKKGRIFGIIGFMAAGAATRIMDQNLFIGVSIAVALMVAVLYLGYKQWHEW